MATISGSGDFAVGFGDDVAPAVAVASTYLLDVAIDEAKNALNDAKSSIVKPIDDIICECKNIFGQCIDCATGDIDLRIHDINQIFYRVSNASLNGLDRFINNAGSHLTNLYAQLPAPWLTDEIPFEPTVSSPAIDHSALFQQLEQSGRDYQSSLGSDTAVTLTSSTDFPLDPLGGIRLGGSSIPVTGGGHSSIPVTSSGSDSCANNLFVPTPFNKGLKVHHTQTEDPERTLVVFNSPDPNNPEGFQYIAFCPDKRPFVSYAADGSGFTCGPCSPTSPTTPANPPAGNTAVSAGCCDTANPFPPAPPINPDPPAPEEGDEACTVSDDAVYSVGDDSAANPSAASTPATLVFNGEGIVNFIMSNGIKGGIPESSLGFPLGFSGSKWISSSIVNKDKTVSWMYSDPATGSTLLSNSKIDPTKLQVGTTNTKCNTKGDSSVPLDDAFWGDTCDPGYYLEFKSAFNGASGKPSETIDKQVDKLYNKAIQYMDSNSNTVSGWISGALLRLSRIGVKIALWPFIAASYAFLIIPKPKNCNNAGFGSLWVLSALSGFAGRWLGLIPEGIHSYITNLLNYSCQYKIMQTPDANAAYLRGRLTKEKWEHALKLDGSCIPWQEIAVDSARPSPPLNVIYGMLKAEIITQDDFDKLVKRVGVDWDDKLPNWETVIEQIPQYGDLIRLMTRDAFDEEAIKVNQYADDFDIKFTGDVKKWAKRQNISENIFKRLWYAHWELPSPTQLFEMLHRLRPSKELKDKDGKPMAVTKEDVLTALKTNDFAPAWVEKLTAISYLKPNTSQIQRMYETGTLTKEECIESYQDAGYNEKDAKDLAKYLTMSSAKNRANFLGMITPDMALKAYGDGSINQDQYKDILTNLGMPDDVANSIVQTAGVKVTITDQAVRMKALRKLFISGGIDKDEYRNRITNTGADSARADKIIARDVDVKNSRFKPIMMAKMCKLVSQGYMDISEYMKRARNLGYSDMDASLMASSCVTEVQEKRRKELEQQQRKELADAQKNKAAADKEIARLQRIEKARSPCKRKAKPDCLPGVEPPV